jgi:uncharacterized protein (TIGR03118 family)
MGPESFLWIANNGTQTTTLYDGTGLKQPLTATLPAGLNGDNNSTGLVFNGSTDFAVSNGTKSGPAVFIFAGENGQISGWAPSVDTSQAFTAYDDGAGGAIYKGLAIAANGTQNLLFATDFHNNKVDVFDAGFHKLAVSGGFTDPTLPSGYAPFGIQAITVSGTTTIYVTYAKQGSGPDEVDGAGLGMLDTFDTNGTLIKHLIPTGGKLNAPWGVTMASSNFGDLSGKLLVGNFGDGWINGFDPATGAFLHAVNDSAGQPIVNQGLWGITFGNGKHNQKVDTLYFTAGVGDESGGLFGRIDLGASAPDISAPTVSLTAPAAGNVSGTVMLTADATDTVGVTSVKFLAGTTVVGSATTAPFQASWDTTTVANGSYQLKAEAADAAGNVTDSTVVTVTVAN